MKELNFLPISFHKNLRNKQRRRNRLLYTLMLVIILGCIHLLSESGHRGSLASYHSDTQYLYQPGASISKVVCELFRLAGDLISLCSLTIEGAPDQTYGNTKHGFLSDGSVVKVVLVGTASSEDAIKKFHNRLSESSLITGAKINDSRWGSESNKEIYKFELTVTIERVTSDHPMW
ncbi:MAG: hypothetical protein JSV03_12715 [Planctomycetota bacterium]|nr:MAG: hypothetical protein JSV03_12715 [Planctomycetota bacterium]